MLEVKRFSLLITVLEVTLIWQQVTLPLCLVEIPFFKSTEECKGESTNLNMLIELLRLDFFIRIDMRITVRLIFLLTSFT